MLFRFLTLAFCCRAFPQDATSERSEQGAILEGPVNSNARFGSASCEAADGDARHGRLRARPPVAWPSTMMGDGEHADRAICGDVIHHRVGEALADPPATPFWHRRSRFRPQQNQRGHAPDLRHEVLAELRNARRIVARRGADFRQRLGMKRERSCGLAQWFLGLRAARDAARSASSRRKTSAAGMPRVGSASSSD